MSKPKNVNEFLSQIEENRKSKDGKPINSVFSRKKFNEFVTLLMNDTDFALEVVTKANDDELITETVNPSELIRKWIQKILEKSGIDKNESAVVLSPGFEIPKADLYPFIAAAVYLYMCGGNKFDFMKTKDFSASLQIKEVDESTKVQPSYHPQTRENLGTYETTTEKHKVLTVKGTTPNWLKHRKLVSKPTNK